MLSVWLGLLLVSVVLAGVGWMAQNHPSNEYRITRFPINSNHEWVSWERVVDSQGVLGTLVLIAGCGACLTSLLGLVAIVASRFGSAAQTRADKPGNLVELIRTSQPRSQLGDPEGLPEVVPESATACWLGEFYSRSFSAKVLSTNDHAGEQLMQWLEGGAKEKAGEAASRIASSDCPELARQILTLYEDDRGVILGRFSAKHWQIQCGAYLKPHTKSKE